MQTTTGSTRAARPRVRQAAAVLLPLGLAGLAYGLWRLSDDGAFSGIADRATFGWAVVMPVWFVAPVVAGFTWRGLSARVAVVVALVVGLTTAGIAAVLFWQASAFPDCGSAGPIRTPGEYIGPSVAVGLVIGAGLTVGAGLAARRAAAGSPVTAVLAGIACQVAAMFLAILVAVGTVFFNCNRG
jgi:hypothetical protein